jgi:thioredoxin reductase (NADPH)
MYDIAIIGGGPAGLTAAIHAERYRLKAITFATKLGGKIENAHTIENWPGDYLISGSDLSSKFINHAKQMNINMIEEQVRSIKKLNNYFILSTQINNYKARNIIIAIGNEKNELNIQGEKEFIKKGVSYNANKDGGLYKDKIVAVIGSGDSACTSAIFLADIAKKVYLMYRSTNLKAEPIWTEKAKNNSKIQLLPSVMPLKILGDDKVNRMICDDGSSVDIDGVFIEIGFSPSKFIVEDLNLGVDGDGFIVVDSNQKTTVNNVWAAGDITTNSSKLRQIITASAEGAVAVSDIFNKKRL